VPQIEVTFDIDANGILDVKAKDRATSREQQVRITASSMLSKNDVDRMVNEAATHADEDKKRKEEVEARNQADALAYQAERTLRDLGDKVSPEDKAETERRVEAVRTALKGSDLAAVKSASDALVEQLQKVGTAAYQAAGAAAAAPGGSTTISRAELPPTGRLPRGTRKSSKASSRKPEQIDQAVADQRSADPGHSDARQQIRQMARRIGDPAETGSSRLRWASSTAISAAIRPGQRVAAPQQHAGTSRPMAMRPGSTALPARRVPAPVRREVRRRNAQRRGVVGRETDEDREEEQRQRSDDQRTRRHRLEKPLMGAGSIWAQAWVSEPVCRATRRTGVRVVTISAPSSSIHARGLTKRFGSFTAVDGVDFDVAPGEAFGFLGPNGAGKTSTMRMIGTVSPVTAGTLTVFRAGSGPRRRRGSGRASAWCRRRTRSTTS
jgi:ABC-type multidrug transport system fused ATPase/permease subunit